MRNFGGSDKVLRVIKKWRGAEEKVGETYEQSKTWSTHKSTYPYNDLNYLTHLRRLFKFAAPPLF